MCTLREFGSAAGIEGVRIRILQSLQVVDRDMDMQEAKQQELTKKIITACLNCRHFRQLPAGGKLHCAVRRCAKPRVRKWIKELEKCEEVEMSIYTGDRSWGSTAEGGRIVKKDGVPLSPAASQELWNHSPNGFEWGYDGSGPAQLALALLLDVIGDKYLALYHYQRFKGQRVALFEDSWKMSTQVILEWIQDQE